MSIQTSTRQVDLENRLKLLQQQIYGKKTSFKLRQEDEAKPQPSHTINHNFLSFELPFVYKDLTKIALLSSLALLTQIVLFLLTQNTSITWVLSR